MKEPKFHIDPLSWAAGVLDGAGRFRIRKQRGIPSGARVYATVNAAVGLRLVEILGGEMSDGVWVLPAEEQEKVLGRMLPYLQGQFDAASKVYRLRLTAPRRMPGWRVSKAVEKFRKKL